MSTRVDPYTQYARTCALAFETSDMGQILDALRFVLGQDQSEIDRWIEFANRNKALAILFANLIRGKPALQEEPNLAYAVSVAGELYRQHIQHLANLQNELRRLIRQHPASDFMAIKGLAIQGDYPRPYRRHLRDLDLYCTDPEAAYRLAEDLHKNGYQIGADEPPWIKYLDPKLQARFSPSSPFMGQINLVHFAGDFICRFDIHFTRYSISYTPVLGTDLRSRSHLMNWDDLPLSVPGAEDCLLILAAHTLSQGAILVKDLNDVAVLLRKPLDWEYVAAQARQAGIDAILRELLYRASTAIPWYPGQQLGSRPLFPRLLPSYRVNWFRRALLNAQNTYLFEKLHFSRWDAVRNGAGCLSYYLMHLEPKVRGGYFSRLLHPPSLPKSLEGLKRHECLRLIPSSFFDAALPQTGPLYSRQVEEQVWTSQIGHANAYYLRSRQKSDVAMFSLNGQTLVPTLTYQFHPQTLNQIADLFEWKSV